MFLKAMVVLSLLALGHMLTSCGTSRDVTSDIEGPYPIKVVIQNSITNQKNLTYSTDIAYKGVLLGALWTLQNNKELTFKVKIDRNYGLFLESVNDVAGNAEEHTYWEILAQLQNGTTIRADAGVGCFVPNPNDVVILKFTTW
ncbi:cobalamin binding intrinsic factor-like [Brachyhypopomus gauderio]|uniref:cobalamin binding intrinsic factor-like n=1 Tax=Brachyhypopomus gauderio TaxID=698409 RepID=UPI00404326A3